MQSVRHFVCLSRLMNHSTQQNITGRCRYMCNQNPTETRIENGIVKQQISFVETESKLPTTLPTTLTIDWDVEMQHILAEEEQENKRSILAPVDDESKIYAEPMLRPTFNLAAYVLKSETLQQFLKLGVDLSRWDKLNVSQSIAKYDFKHHIEPFILLLTKDIGIPIDGLGKILSKNPDIMKENLDDLLVRVNYLALKRFTKDEIVEIITRNPFWLSHSTREIDKRLGFFQKHFGLVGFQVRLLTLNCPKLITHNLEKVQQVSFSILEECGFTKLEMRKLALRVPKVWMMRKFIGCYIFIYEDACILFTDKCFVFSDRLDLMRQYDYILDHMKIDNSLLIKQPHILTDRLYRIKERHGFLKRIGRAQYNPKLELYVSLNELCRGTNEEFCEKIAKRPYEEFDQYLRTL